MPQPIRRSAVDLDLSPRVVASKAVVASPSAATETIIASLTIPSFGDLSIVSGIQLEGWAAFTVGTNGVSANLRIRQTDASGTIIAATGATTVTAADLRSLVALGFDATAGVSVYVLTLTVGSGSAASTVSGVLLRAIAA